MTYRADLHIHSYASDGQWSPEEIVEQIKKHQIRTFAVSDHDEVGCIPHMSRLTEGQDLDYIKAVEISVLYKGKEHHVLTYYIDETDPVLLEIIDSNRALREDYNVGLIDFLNPQYPQVTHEDYGQYSYMPY